MGRLCHSYRKGRKKDLISRCHMCSINSIGAVPDRRGEGRKTYISWRNSPSWLAFMPTLMVSTTSILTIATTDEVLPPSMHTMKNFQSLQNSPRCPRLCSPNSSRSEPSFMILSVAMSMIVTAAYSCVVSLTAKQAIPMKPAEFQQQELYRQTIRLQ
jgi:hypothetical protein